MSHDEEMFADEQIAGGDKIMPQEVISEEGDSNVPDEKVEVDDIKSKLSLHII